MHPFDESNLLVAKS